MNNDTMLNVDSLSKELQLILEIISAEDSEMTKGNICTDNIDWDQFILLTFHHRIFFLCLSKDKRN